MPDPQPTLPKPPANDADRPRWVKDDMIYKEQLSAWLARQSVLVAATKFRPGSAAHTDHMKRGLR